MLYLEQTLLREVLGEVRRLMPFELLGFHTDNDTATCGLSGGRLVEDLALVNHGE